MDVNVDVDACIDSYLKLKIAQHGYIIWPLATM